MYKFLERDNSINNLDIFFEEVVYYETKKTSSTKWAKFKRYVAKKCIVMSELKDRKVYVETLSVVSVKRTLNRLCNKVFQSRYSGYQNFLSDEEKRLCYAVNHRSLVEGLAN